MERGKNNMMTSIFNSEDIDAATSSDVRYAISNESFTKTSNDLFLISCNEIRFAVTKIIKSYLIHEGWNSLIVAVFPGVHEAIRNNNNIGGDNF
jgi:hypothetical protein